MRKYEIKIKQIKIDAGLEQVKFAVFGESIQAGTCCTKYRFLERSYLKIPSQKSNMEEMWMIRLCGCSMVCHSCKGLNWWHKKWSAHLNISHGNSDRVMRGLWCCIWVKAVVCSLENKSITHKAACHSVWILRNETSPFTKPRVLELK